MANPYLREEEWMILNNYRKISPGVFESMGGHNYDRQGNPLGRQRMGVGPRTNIQGQLRQGPPPKTQGQYGGNRSPYARPTNQRVQARQADIKFNQAPITPINQQSKYTTPQPPSKPQPPPPTQSQSDETLRRRLGIGEKKGADRAAEQMRQEASWNAKLQQIPSITGKQLPKPEREYYQKDEHGMPIVNKKGEVKQNVFYQQPGGLLPIEYYQYKGIIPMHPEEVFQGLPTTGQQAPKLLGLNAAPGQVPVFTNDEQLRLAGGGAFTGRTDISLPSRFPRTTESIRQREKIEYDKLNADLVVPEQPNNPQQLQLGPASQWTGNPGVEVKTKSELKIRRGRNYANQQYNERPTSSFRQRQRKLRDSKLPNAQPTLNVNNVDAIEKLKADQRTSDWVKSQHTPASLNQYLADNTSPISSGSITGMYVPLTQQVATPPTQTPPVNFVPIIPGAEAISSGSFSSMEGQNQAIPHLQNTGVNKTINFNLDRLDPNYQPLYSNQQGEMEWRAEHFAPGNVLFHAPHESMQVEGFHPIVPGAEPLSSGSFSSSMEAISAKPDSDGINRQTNIPVAPTLELTAKPEYLQTPESSMEPSMDAIDPALFSREIQTGSVDPAALSLTGTPFEPVKKSLPPKINEMLDEEQASLVSSNMFQHVINPKVSQVVPTPISGVGAFPIGSNLSVRQEPAASVSQDRYNLIAEELNNPTPSGRVVGALPPLINNHPHISDDAKLAGTAQSTNYTVSTNKDGTVFINDQTGKQNSVSEVQSNLSRNLSNLDHAVKSGKPQSLKDFHASQAVRNARLLQSTPNAIVNENTAIGTSTPNQRPPTVIASPSLEGQNILQQLQQQTESQHVPSNANTYPTTISTGEQKLSEISLQNDQVEDAMEYISQGGFVPNVEPPIPGVKESRIMPQEEGFSEAQGGGSGGGGGGRKRGPKKPPRKGGKKPKKSVSFGGAEEMSIGGTIRPKPLPRQYSRSAQGHFWTGVNMENPEEVAAAQSNVLTQQDTENKHKEYQMVSNVRLREKELDQRQMRDYYANELAKDRIRSAFLMEQFKAANAKELAEGKFRDQLLAQQITAEQDQKRIETLEKGQNYRKWLALGGTALGVGGAAFGVLMASRNRDKKHDS